MIRKLKILHVAFSLDPGGMENGIVNVANHLNGDEFQIDVCCLERRGAFADRLPPKSTVSVLNKKPGKSLSTIWKLNRLIRDTQPDIIHSHNLGPLIYASWSTFYGRLCPILQGEHGQLPPDELSDKRLRQRKKHYGACRLVHTVSDALRDRISDLKLISEDKLVSIPNGVDTDRFRPMPPAESRQHFAIPPDATVIGSAGRLVASKRFDELMDAFDRLDDPTCYLMIIGDGECFDELTSKRNSLASADRIILTGYIDQPETAYNAIDLFVLPSDIEGLSNVLLEAMATGVPCLVNEACGNNDVIKDNKTGFLSTMPTTDELTHSLEVALTQKATWQALGDAGRQAVKQSFSMEAMAQNYADIYRQVKEMRE